MYDELRRHGRLRAAGNVRYVLMIIQITVMMIILLSSSRRHWARWQRGAHDDARRRTPAARPSAGRAVELHGRRRPEWPPAHAMAAAGRALESVLAARARKVRLRALGRWEVRRRRRLRPRGVGAHLDCELRGTRTLIARRRDAACDGAWSQRRARPYAAAASTAATWTRRPRLARRLRDGRVADLTERSAERDFIPRRRRVGAPQRDGLSDGDRAPHLPADWHTALRSRRRRPCLHRRSDKIYSSEREPHIPGHVAVALPARRVDAVRRAER